MRAVKKHTHNGGTAMRQTKEELLLRIQELETKKKELEDLLKVKESEKQKLVIENHKLKAENQSFQTILRNARFNGYSDLDKKNNSFWSVIPWGYVVKGLIVLIILFTLFIFLKSEYHQRFDGSQSKQPVNEKIHQVKQVALEKINLINELKELINTEGCGYNFTTKREKVLNLTKKCWELGQCSEDDIMKIQETVVNLNQRNHCTGIWDKDLRHIFAKK